jgi:hypothetical protein
VSPRQVTISAECGNRAGNRAGYLKIPGFVAMQPGQQQDWQEQNSSEFNHLDRGFTSKVLECGFLFNDDFSPPNSFRFKSPPGFRPSDFGLLVVPIS